MTLDNALLDVNMFSLQCELNCYGKVQFWTELDNQIEKFEKRAISLKSVHKFSPHNNDGSDGYDRDHEAEGLTSTPECSPFREGMRQHHDYDRRQNTIRPSEDCHRSNMAICRRSNSRPFYCRGSRSRHPWYGCNQCTTFRSNRHFDD